MKTAFLLFYFSCLPLRLHVQLVFINNIQIQISLFISRGLNPNRSSFEWEIFTAFKTKNCQKYDLINLAEIDRCDHEYKVFFVSSVSFYIFVWQVLFKYLDNLLKLWTFHDILKVFNLKTMLFNTLWIKSKWQIIFTISLFWSGYLLKLVGTFAIDSAKEFSKFYWQTKLDI